MLLRIVRMSFDPDKVDEFLSLFNQVSEKIRFIGIPHYLLNTWAKIKILFNDKSKAAFSLENLIMVDSF